MEQTFPKHVDLPCCLESRCTQKNQARSFMTSTHASVRCSILVFTDIRHGCRYSVESHKWAACSTVLVGIRAVIESTKFEKKYNALQKGKKKVKRKSYYKSETNSSGLCIVAGVQCHLTNELTVQCIQAKFPKPWTSLAHSFLQQIAQNKNWAHRKATTLPRICEVEMQQASLLYYSAKPQSGGILGCALVCPTSLYVRTIPFPTFCRSLPSVGAYSQYPAWSGCRRSADVPRADHDRVGSSPWQGMRVYCACLPSICLIFSTCKYAATAFNFKHKKTINVTDLPWSKTFRYRF